VLRLFADFVHQCLLLELLDGELRKAEKLVARSSMKSLLISKTSSWIAAIERVETIEVHRTLLFLWNTPYILSSKAFPAPSSNRITRNGATTTKIRRFLNFLTMPPFFVLVHLNRNFTT